MKIYHISELQDIHRDQGYRHYGLFDQQGKQIIAFNSNRSTANDRLKEIIVRLNSPGLRDGYYIVKAKNSTGKTIVPDEFTMYKGNLEEAADKVIHIQPTAPIQPVSPEVLTYESALRLQVENATLKMQIENLTKKVSDLEEEIKELETNPTLSEDQNNSVWSNAKDFLAQIMEVGAPLLDKHFELKEKQLTLQAIKLQGNPTTNKNTNPTVNPEAENKKIIENFIMSKKDDEECYIQLVELYNNAESQKQFLDKLKDENLELFTELVHGNGTRT